MFVCHYLHSILSITICNLLIELPSYIVATLEIAGQQTQAIARTTNLLDYVLVYVVFWSRMQVYS
jgi:hypothetical protein